MSVFATECWPGPANPKAEKPCNSYSGNLCGGFGGKTICMTCGWDLYMHGPPPEVLDKVLLEE